MSVTFTVTSPSILTSLPCAAAAAILLCGSTFTEVVAGEAVPIAPNSVSRVAVLRTTRPLVGQAVAAGVEQESAITDPLNEVCETLEYAVYDKPWDNPDVGVYGSRSWKALVTQQPTSGAVLGAITADVSELTEEILLGLLAPAAGSSIYFEVDFASGALEGVPDVPSADENLGLLVIRDVATEAIVYVKVVDVYSFRAGTPTDLVGVNCFARDADPAGRPLLRAASDAGFSIRLHCDVVASEFNRVFAVGTN